MHWLLTRLLVTQCFGSRMGNHCFFKFSKSQQFQILPFSLGFTLPKLTYLMGRYLTLYSCLLSEVNGERQTLPEGNSSHPNPGGQYREAEFHSRDACLSLLVTVQNLYDCLNLEHSILEV